MPSTTPPRAPGRVAAVLLVALVMLTAAVGLHWSPLADLDQRVADHAYAATLGHPGATRAWLDVSAWGSPMVMRGVLLVIGVAMLARRAYLDAGWVVAVTVAEAVVAPATKLVLERPRPSWPVPIASAASTSYPSGHAAASATMAAVVLMLVLDRGSGKWQRRVVPTPAVLAAAMIAASRVFLGVHYLSDVVGGALLGVALTVGSWWLAERASGPRVCGHRRRSA